MVGITWIQSIRKKKKLCAFIYAVLILWIVALLQTVINYGQSRESYLEQALAELETTSVESSIEITTKVGKLDDKQAQDRLRKIIQWIAPLDDTAIHSVSTIHAYGYRWAKGNTIITMTAQKDKGVYYLHMMGSNYGQKVDWEKWLKEQGYHEIQSTFTLKNVLSERLDDSSYQPLCEEMLRKVGGKVCYVQQQDNSYTCYGYAPQLANAIETSHGKMNLTIAITNEKDMNQTVVYLATPIMNQDY